MEAQQMGCKVYKDIPRKSLTQNEALYTKSGMLAKPSLDVHTPHHTVLDT